MEKFIELFGLIADAIKQISQATGDPPEVVRARVAAWLLAGAEDATDPVLAEILEHYKDGA